MSKSELRKKQRQVRIALSAALREDAAIIAANQFAASQLFETSQHIACYFSQGSEFITAPLIQSIWQAGKLCYLPVLAADHALHFAPYHENDSLVVNRYQIHEPVIDAKKYFATENLDCVLVPLIAFDLQGHRLGSGGGYYDRTFAFLKNASIKPVLIGVGFQNQRVDALPHDEWDLSLNGVLTEKKLIMFS